MVLLTMTASIVEALKKLDEPTAARLPNTESSDEQEGPQQPSLADAAAGNPISHGQIIHVWRQLKAGGSADYSLESLLRGATVYNPPPPPKPEPSAGYKALMARLRREEEERSYERMLKAPPNRETFAQRFPMSTMSLADSFAEANKPVRQSDMGDDGMAQAEVQQQVTLIFNFLISIIGCAAAIWIAAQWWSTTARLFLTLGGSIIVAVAEVAVYSAYSWRMTEGDRKQKGTREVKEIMKTWVIGEDNSTKEGYEPVLIQAKDPDTDMNLRKRVLAPE